MTDRPPVAVDRQDLQEWLLALHRSLRGYEGSNRDVRMVAEAIRANLDRPAPPLVRLVARVSLINSANQVTRQEVECPVGRKAVAPFTSEGPWIISVEVDEEPAPPGPMTPEEWGVIPARCKAWPWDGCPDCDHSPGFYHSPTCGALDRDGS